MTAPAEAASPSDCPRVDAIWSELETLMSGAGTAQQTPNAEQMPAIEVEDLGAAFRVAVGGRSRRYEDGGRDCARRARVASVFVAVALGPPTMWSEPATSAVAVAVEAPQPRMPPARTVHLEVSVAVDGGVGTGDRAILVGPASRAVVGAGPLRFVCGVAVFAPADTMVGDVVVRQWHVPVDVGLRAGRHVGHFDLSADLGFAGGLLLLSAPNLAASRANTAIEWGARVGVTARYQALARLAPFLAGGAQLVANPSELFLLPEGVIGRAPIVWIGARAGMSVGF